MSADEGGLGARVRAALDGYVSGVSLLDEVTDCVMDSVADEFWRLTDERDQTRAVVARVRAAMSNHPDPCEKHDEGDAFSCGWKRAYADVRAALGDDLTSGRDQAARPSSTPPRPSEHTPRPADWTYDSPAVQPNQHNDEESDR